MKLARVHRNVMFSPSIVALNTARVLREHNPSLNTQHSTLITQHSTLHSFQRRYSCEASNNSYAIGFGDTICNEFDDWRNKFTDTGKMWIDSTRACLQVGKLKSKLPFSVT